MTVSQWSDTLSGNNRHLLQASAPAQPTIVANALNGYPGLLFDGVGDFMSATFSVADPIEIYAVGKWNTATLNTAMFDGQSNTRRVFEIASATSCKIAAFVAFITFTADPTNYAIYRLRYDALGSQAAVNGQFRGSGTNIGTQTPTAFTIGASGGPTNFAHCTIVAIYGYKPTLAPGDARKLEMYLNRKYNIYAESTRSATFGRVAP